jgi:hypothetical protein
MDILEIIYTRSEDVYFNPMAQEPEILYAPCFFTMENDFIMEADEGLDQGRLPEARRGLPGDKAIELGKHFINFDPIL